MVKYLQWGFASCFNCGSFWTSPARRLCHFCEKSYQERATAEILDLGGHTIRFLFDWRKDDQALRRLILSLKGSAQGLAWRYWAERFAYEHRLTNRTRFMTFVSAPRAEEGIDHSALFAQEMAKLFGARYAGRPLLKRRPGRSLGLLRHQRWDRRRFVKNSSFVEKEARLWVLIDDVRTSGATARAVYEALGQPTTFEHWVLAYRPPKVDASHWL